MECEALPVVRLLALEMLERNSPALLPHEGAFLGQCAIMSEKMTAKQARWFNILLGRCGMVALQVEEMAQ